REILVGQGALAPAGQLRTRCRGCSSTVDFARGVPEREPARNESRATPARRGARVSSTAAIPARGGGALYATGACCRCDAIGERRRRRALQPTRQSSPGAGARRRADEVVFA